MTTIQYRQYTVTITPKMTTYSGSDTYGEYTVEYTAKTAADAIKQARAERNESEGRYGVPATYRARLTD